METNFQEKEPQISWATVRTAFLRRALKEGLGLYLTTKEKAALLSYGELPSDLVIHYKRPLWAGGKLTGENLVIISREQAGEIAKQWAPLEGRAIKGEKVVPADFAAPSVIVHITSHYRNKER